MQPVDMYAAAKTAGVDLMWTSTLLHVGGTDTTTYSREEFHGFRTAGDDVNVSFAQDAMGIGTARVSQVTGIDGTGHIVATAVSAEVLEGGRTRFAISQTGVYRYSGFGHVDGRTSRGYVLALSGCFGMEYVEITPRQARAVLAVSLTVPREALADVLSDDPAVMATSTLSIPREAVEAYLV